VDVVEVLEPQQVREVGDVGGQPDVRRQGATPLALAGQRRGVDVVAGGLEASPDVAPAPAAVHGAVHEYEGRHGVRLLGGGPTPERCPSPWVAASGATGEGMTWFMLTG